MREDASGEGYERGRELGEEGEEERRGLGWEGKKERSRRGFHSDRKFQQNKLAGVLTTQHHANFYTQRTNGPVLACAALHHGKQSNSLTGLRLPVNGGKISVASVQFVNTKLRRNRGREAFFFRRQ